MQEYTKSELRNLMETLDENPGALDKPFRCVAETDPAKQEPDYIATPSAKKMHNSGAVYQLLRGPIGCGKSYAVVRQILNIMCSIPPSKITGERLSRILVIRNTADQLKNATWNTWREAFPDNIPYEFFPSTMTFRCRFLLDDGSWVKSEVLFRAYELESSLRGLDGLEVTAVWGNEARSIASDIFTRAVSRIRYPGENHIDLKDMRAYVLLDTNSFPKSNWLFSHFYEKNKNNPLYNIIDYPSALSPDAENLDRLRPDYYKNLMGMDDNYIRAFIKNEFVSAATGLKCWPSFDSSTNVITKPANILFPIFLGIDNGRDCASVLCNDLGDGRVHVIDSWHTKGEALNTSLDRMLEYYTRRYPPENWRWDYSSWDPGFQAGEQTSDLCGEDFLLAAFQKYDLPVGTKATTNDPETRIRAVDSLFAKKNHLGIPMLTISDTCHELITACQEYQYKRVTSFAEGDSVGYSEKAKKDDASDWCDSLQYAILRAKSGGAKLARQSVFHTTHNKTASPVLKTYVPDNSSGILV